MRLLLAFVVVSLTMTDRTAFAEPKLTHVRFTNGELGGTRTSAEYLPGDAVIVSYDIEGISSGDTGRVEYYLGMEIVTKQGKTIEKPNQARKIDFIPLGGESVPASAYYSLQPDHPPGEYFFKVTVVDPITKTLGRLEKPFTVKQPEFGIVRVFTSVDDRGQFPAPTTGVVGQTCYVHCGVVGFARDLKRMNQPNLQIEMIPLDAQGTPTLKKPYLLTFEEGLAEGSPLVFVNFLLPLWREGKFTIRLKATDTLSKKVATYDLPVAVVPHGN